MNDKTSKDRNLSRRSFLRQGGVAGVIAAGMGPYLKLAPAAYANAGPASPLSTFRYVPFSQKLPCPSRMAPVKFGAGSPFGPLPGAADARVGSSAVYHGTAPEYYNTALYDKNDPAYRLNDPDEFLPDGTQNPNFGLPFAERYHALSICKFQHQFITGVKTPMFGYNGIFPGQTMRARLGEPMVVRVRNDCADLETSLHLHGGHTPSHSDGHPCFYTFPGKVRDYFYPHIAPKHHAGGPMDTNDAPSTMWYHDHGNDVTAYNVVHGLVGFSLLTDTFEENLIKAGVIPDVDLRDQDIANGGKLVLDANGATQQGPYDLPLALTDQRFNADGSLWYDMLDHDGRIGDVYTVNGTAQPFVNVEPRQYRLRLCGSSPARVYMLRFSTGQTMLQIGHDSWMLPKAVEVSQIYLNPARRADVIVDFSKFSGQTIYLENIMKQSSGRKPDGVDPRAPERVMQFRVGAKSTINPKFRARLNIAAGTPLRPHTPLLEKDATVTRYFDFNRSNGAWQVNQEFYSAFRCDAAIKKGALEKWGLRNGSGGWWHPIHMHLEGHQTLRINGKTPTLETWRYKSDHASLEDNMTFEVLMKFRTFTGPFVFHCHNNQHEDMRMMK
ncbi:MAG: multicopper oxidase domain-containing protein, partial [Opitutaceae bacterium]